MKKINYIVLAIVFALSACNSNKQMENKQSKTLSAQDILGNPEYQAISYGGYRGKSREQQPTVEQLKEDMKVLQALDIKVLRTYNVHLPHAKNLLKAIAQLKQEDQNFEMYVMLGAWIDCKNAWTELEPDHTQESERNAEEIAEAVRLANQYPEIVKVIAVGNEAMVKWQTNYYVPASVILKWVKHLQKLKEKGKLNKDLWITSSDDFASWGGGEPEYHTEDLNELIRNVDFISMHTYPFHNTHYNPDFWTVPAHEVELSPKEQVDAAMQRSLEFAQMQYDSVVGYMRSLGVEKEVHIGETGWATISTGFYGKDGSHAADEYKQAQYYNLIRNWTNEAGIACFYFEAFNEPWKDGSHHYGSENHFGLFTVDGKAKYLLWENVDNGDFKDLKRGSRIVKTLKGNEEKILGGLKAPPFK